MNTAVLKFVDGHDPFKFGELEGTIVTTESQREVWLAAQFGDGASASFNESVFVRLSGPVDEKSLVGSLKALWARHDSVRGCFSNDGEEMVIYKNRPAPIYSHDLSALPQTTRDNQIADLAREAVTEPFDLFDGPLARFDVIRCNDADTRVLLTLHHSICDGWSLYILASELGTLYSTAGNTADPRTLETAPKFSDYADWERSEEIQDLRDQSISYWTQRFAGGIPSLDLPYDRPRPLVRSFGAYRLDKPLPMALVNDLKSLAAKNNSTITTTLMAAFAAYLHRISGCEDIVLGIPFAGQMAKEEHSLVGHCVNILPLYISVSQDDSFAVLLEKTQQSMLEAFEHQYLTYGTLLQTLGVTRDPSKPPLVSVLFNVDQANESDFQFEGLQAVFESNPRAYENFDLNLNITLSGQAAVIECTHNLELWNTETIDRRIDEWVCLLQKVLANPSARLTEHDLIREADLALYQAQWAKVERPYDLGNASLHGLVEATVDQFPDRTALVFEGSSLSYRELDRQANRLAHWLIDRGVEANSIVPILMDRSLEMLVAINGILKAGGAYLPLDPDHPHDRLAFIIDEVDANFVLTQTTLRDRVPSDIEAIALDAPALDLGKVSELRPNVPCSPTQLAYVIYTSGSTGNPKGVMIEHQSICNHMLWMREALPLDEHDSVMLKTPYTFDVSLCELFLPLMCGCPLVIARPGGHKDPGYLLSLINEHHITHIHFVPSLAFLFLDDCNQSNCPSLRRFVLTGEAVSTELEARFQQTFPQADCWNLYGPTEAAVHACLWLCGQETSEYTVPIGTALPNTRLYVVNGQMQLLGPGLVGELLIAGVQVARGYVNRAELNRERFVEDPFSSTSFKVYHTGDLVKMRPDGVLEYIGRNDFQVKLRGLRIELGEIESVILRYPGITQCSVLAREDRKNDQRLVAYLVAQSEMTDWLPALKDHIARNLPEYMVPQHFLQLATLPLTSSGKTDRKALPQPDIESIAESDYSPPETTLESELCALWSDVLGVHKLSVDANFFDLGGHSLLGTQMLAQIKSKYGVALGLGRLFEVPTVRAMAQLLDQALKAGQEQQQIEKRPQDATVYATHQQQVWYLQEQIDPDANAFNLPAIFRLHGELDTQALEQALNTILQRHEILRSNFTNPEGEVEIHTDKTRSISLPLQALSDYGASDIETLEQALQDEVAKTFDIASEPLFKANLIRVNEQDHALFLMIHHLIFDGWSFDLLLKELCALYNAYSLGLGNPLPPLPVQFHDFALWQHGWLQSEVVEEHLAYWKAQLSGELPVLNLPTDFERPHTQPHRAEGVKFRIDQAEVDALEALAVRHQTTLFMVLMALYVLMLHRFSRQSDLIVNVPVYARHQEELQGLMGPLINVLVCRFHVNQGQSFDDLVQHVKTTILAAIDHQDVPFDLLVRTVNPPRDASRNPIAQTLFNYQDVRNRMDQMNGIQRSQINLDRVGVETDLDVWFKRQLNGMEVGFEYPIELFERSTVEGFVNSFKNSVQTLTEQKDEVALDHLVSASPEEFEKISRWNDTTREWPFRQGFLSEFEQQVQSLPDKTACHDQAQACTYQQLDARSNQLARAFAAKGVKGGDIVALLLERTVDLPATVIALWKLGAAYVPLDPAYPEDRIKAILSVAQVSLLVTQAHFSAAQDAHDGPIVLLDTDAPSIAGESQAAVDTNLTADQLAYVIFTSGSTGTPKGVEISHGALHNFLKAVSLEPGFTANDRLLAVTTLAFDISLLELFLPLSTGASIIIASNEQSSDPQQLIKLIEQHQVSTLQATPATWRLLLNAGFTAPAPLKGLIGGEKLPTDLAESLIANGVELWNMYGPTEATVWTSCFRVTAAAQGQPPRILIGRPLANTQLHILDDNRNPLPLGVYGELWIGGAGLAEGYRANPAQTADRFVTFPDGKRLYRTGDVARWTLDGQIEFGDRIDNQVKVRGYRIELEEIEINLRKHTGIADAAVVVQEYGADDHRLSAHITYAGDEHPTSSELRRHLRKYLPDYMMPQHFTVHDQLPLLPSGKVNRKLLAATDNAPSPVRASHREPNETEAHLISIWQALLKRQQIQLEDQFLDVGGHSLLALKLLVDIEKAFGAKLMPQDLWVNTLEQLAKLIEQKQTSQVDVSDLESKNKARKGGIGMIKRIFGSS
ncbi:non-ribosomal peptide synthetase [Marinobacter zhejiangensis]|uniref:Amino acid adenylation domain-containing protein n=1 Tax=Marinobacter zhejiangensis TaxID=488535 RepID=A0A1I4RNX3_9GAMM|nr:non-ribosomal peptide synthetase [Marinobacter zhejiangensis]SFM53904.1 amino acid adenylation domain-containing protein [Marinobacter zhejiangensis]